MMKANYQKPKKKKKREKPQKQSKKTVLLYNLENYSYSYLGKLYLAGYRTFITNYTQIQEDVKLLPKSKVISIRTVERSDYSDLQIICKDPVSFAMSYADSIAVDTDVTIESDYNFYDLRE